MPLIIAILKFELFPPFVPVNSPPNLIGAVAVGETIIYQLQASILLQPRFSVTSSNFISVGAVY